MFRFPIRDLLFVITLAGVALGWVIDHRAQVATKEEYQKGYEQAVRHAELLDSSYELTLTQFGFGIERGPHGEVRSVTLPPYVTGAPAAVSAPPSNRPSRTF